MNDAEELRRQISPKSSTVRITAESNSNALLQSQNRKLCRSLIALKGTVSRELFSNWDLEVIDYALLMCRNHFLNFCTLPLICYNILKMASIEVKLISSSFRTRIQVVVSGTDLAVNFCVRICMSRIPCLRLCPARKQAMLAGLSNLEIRQQSAE